MLKLLMNKNVKYNDQFPKGQNKEKIFERNSVTISLIVSYAAVFSGVTQRSPQFGGGGALRDATKNGCVRDYFTEGTK